MFNCVFRRFHQTRYKENLLSRIFLKPTKNLGWLTQINPTPIQLQAVPLVRLHYNPTPLAQRHQKTNMASETEKLDAETFKNQGNEFMKQDKYKEAFVCFTKAIEIDNNNAIYYCNRAASSSKLGDNRAALEDSKKAVEIDPTYSKGYGRMGLAYARMRDHRNAKKALTKAVELDPNNESYKNNLKTAEKKLQAQPFATEPNSLYIWRSYVSDDYLRSEMRRRPGLKIYDLADGPPGPGRVPINLSLDTEQPDTNTQDNSNTEEIIEVPMSTKLRILK